MCDCVSGLYHCENFGSSTLAIVIDRYVLDILIRVSSRGGAGGKLPPQTAQLPPQKKKRRKEKRGRERERGRGREREREMGESIYYLGIMIYVSNISLIITNIKLMYKNTLCTHGEQMYVKVPHPLLPQIKFSG